MTEGVTAGRFKVGAWLVGQDRNTAFDGSSEVDNPLRERTRILLPLATLDVRVTDRVGVQLAGTIPDVTRTAAIEVKVPIHRSLANTQLDSPAIVQVGISRAF